MASGLPAPQTPIEKEIFELKKEGNWPAPLRLTSVD